MTHISRIRRNTILIFLANILSVSAVALAFTNTSAAAFPATDHVDHAQNLDEHRVAIIESYLLENGNAHIHLTLSNGWRFDPWWVSITITFYSNGIVANSTTVSTKCPPSFGGHANECYDDYDIPGAFWASADNVSITGQLWSGNGGSGENGWTLPLINSDF